MKNINPNKYLLRMQCLNFLIVVDKETGEYENLYATDTKEGRKYLAYIAKHMEKHPSIKYVYESVM